MSGEALKRKLIEMLTAESSSDGDATESDDDSHPSSVIPEFERADSNCPQGSQGVDSGFRAIDQALRLPETELASLRRDCRVVFALGSSNWLDAKATPRCTLERLALAVFEARTNGVAFDSARSGAEWWAQVRTEGHVDEGVQFHWDIDENICDSVGPLFCERASVRNNGSTANLQGRSRRGLLIATGPTPLWLGVPWCKIA